jgi:hypothetical protein
MGQRVEICQKCGFPVRVRSNEPCARCGGFGLPDPRCSCPYFRNGLGVSLNVRASTDPKCPVHAVAANQQAVESGHTS